MKMMLKTASRAIAICFLACNVIACNSNDSNNTLVVYVSADDKIAREVFNAYTEKTGVAVEWVGDTELTKTTALVQRLKREKNNPIADVFWSSEVLGTIQLADDGVLADCKQESLKEWPKNYRDEEYRWFGFSPRARVIAYDPEKIAKEELPLYWWEYGEAVMADPRFGTTLTHVSVMAEYPSEAEALFVSMEKRPLLGGNSATVQAVVDGSARYGMTDSDDVHAAIARGDSIAMHFPRHHAGSGGGTLLIPNTVAIVKHCDHPQLAEDFVIFLLSDEVATLLAKSTSHNIPIQPTVQAMFPELIVEDPLQVNFGTAASSSERQVSSVMEMLSQ
jgi:iron(III) transport system substrate-binding protein